MKMCEMHIHTLDFGTVLKDRLKPPDQPIAQQGIHTRGYSEARKGPTITVQLHGGLRSPNMTITPAGTTNNPCGQGCHVHRQCHQHLIDGYV
jgi:hypothetical protein